jgi:mannose/fructose/N-acetylgalactosamine-specific phosphotransferase system component IID
MGLKINTEIQTDKGTITGVYVRIINYSLSKYGNFTLNYQLFSSEEAKEALVLYSEYLVKSEQVGNQLNIMLGTPIQETITIKRQVTVSEGSTEERTEQRVVDRIQPDLSPLENVNIFTFGYAKVKEKLVSLYGAENIIDC